MTTRSNQTFFIRSTLLSCASIAVLLASVFPAVADTAKDNKTEEKIPENVVVTGIRPKDDGKVEKGYKYSVGTLGPLGDLPLQDTPYSLNVTSGELIENTNAHSQADALRTNPTAVMLVSSGTASSMARMKIRGFTAADQSELRDGLVDRSFCYPPMENVDRIEVLNGFSGFLYGFSALGGSLNYISKGPTDAPQLSLATGVYDLGIGYIHGDFGGPVPYTNGKVGYRLNVYHENGEATVADSVQNRTFISGRVVYAPIEGTSLWADVWMQDHYRRGLEDYFYIDDGVDVPHANVFKASTQYGQNWTYSKAKKTLLGFGFDSRITGYLSVRGGYRFGHMWRESMDVDNEITDNAGNYIQEIYTMPRMHEKTHSAYLLADTTFDTFGIKHNITAGYTGTDYYYDRGAYVYLPSVSSNIYSPNYATKSSYTVGGKNQQQEQFRDSIMIGDRILLTDSLSAIVGVNYAMLQQKAAGTGTVISTSNYSANKLTPSYALIYKIVPEVSVYASYMEALSNGESTTNKKAVNAYQVLSPSSSSQYEIGVKTTLGGMFLTAALFRIDKINAELDPTDYVYRHDGRQIHQGLEITATGKLFDDVTLIGGFTWMDPHVEKATANTAIEGKMPYDVPKTLGKLYAEYKLPLLPALTVSAGAEYSGRRAYDVYNKQFIPGAVVFDAGLRYQTEVNGHKVSFNLTASNLFDRSYWVQSDLQLGMPRIVSFTVKSGW